MDSRAFVDQLETHNREVLDRLRQEETPQSECQDIPTLLRVALKNELEAVELAARWLPTTPEIDVKLGFARQAGDEAKHYGLIEDRLEALGVSVEGMDVLVGGFSPLTEFLLTLEDTVSRLAAGQFTREAIALVKNEQFIALCHEQGDETTACLYTDTIQSDERYHQQLGRRFLIEYAISDEQQQQAHEVCQKTLALAEELQGMFAERVGTARGPGC